MAWKPGVLAALDRPHSTLTAECSYGANGFGAAAAYREPPHFNHHEFTPGFTPQDTEDMRLHRAAEALRNPLASLDLSPQATPKASPPATPEAALRSLQASMRLK